MAPCIIFFPQGVDEIGQHAKLGSKFVKAYSDSMLGQLEGFFKVNMENILEFYALSFI